MPFDKSGDTALGFRVAMLRSQRGISRRVLANLVGRSEEWLRLIEIGRRPLDSLSIVLQIAEILHVSDVAAFIGTRPEVRRPEAQMTTRLSALRRVVTEVPWMRATAPLPVDDPGATLAALWERWRTSPTRYTEIAVGLPPLLAHFQDLSETEPGQPRWNTGLISCYVLARSVFNRTGEHDVARLAADRALRAASTSALDWMRPIAVWHLGCALLHIDQLRPALDCVDTAVDRMHEFPSHAADRAWLTGALHLLAAEIAAAQYDPATANTALGRAGRIADGMDEDRSQLGVWCGPTELGIVRIRVALQLGDIEQALRFARTLHIPHGYSAERVARHYVALAGAYASRHNDVAAVYALTKVEQVSPEDIYFNANAHRTLRLLADRNDLTVRSDLERLLNLVPAENVNGLTPQRRCDPGGYRESRHRFFTI
ncbi:helix-turn-helix domain-containing protein [Stackebrandtia nassauensis]|uniref:Putative transcriptional regulator, XRE family n=1 Tax=Stackebrandtia nassauensis (strain DSM 44728 / CIP 108903 / NRRL B-16338 / NBRC 102104 / LLR-40K-21) TaxID=446470 RepID=D3Q2L1_STANL|nr:helix-turn-helix transcriptional regulator [Stackebrandtia nassauensis]ADD45762.1 putative transcriptional regulator, XRE family [Stackebrandtia nassauensis DSM 44728]